jgi:hypothetical protein
MPVILATQEGAIRKIMVQSQPGNVFSRPYLKKKKKNLHKKGLIEWFKV